MNFKKSFIFVVLFAILYSPVKSFAFPNPSIQFNRIVGEGNVPFTITGENFNIPAGDEGYFKRLIGIKKADIEQKNQSLTKLIPKNLKGKMTGITDNLKYITFSDSGIFPLVENGNIILNPMIYKEGIYSLNEDNLTTGYCLLEPLVITTFMNASVFQQITSLPANSHYLQGKLTIPVGTTLNIYEKENGSYIERYAIFNTSKNTYLLMDAFYPKVLETNLEKSIIQALNGNMDSDFKIDNLLN